jgi:hypothetical protein
MAASGETIAAMSANNVTFARDEIAWGETSHAITDAIDNSNKFVPDHHRHGNRFLRPGVPIVYMYVCSADRRFQNADENIVAANFRNRNVFEPETGLRFALDDCLHRFLHDEQVRRIRNAGKPFVIPSESLP